MSELFKLDPIHESIDSYAQPICQWVWREKYRWASEAHPFESHERVVNGVYAKDPVKEEAEKALAAMNKGLWLPGGRIQAGAGTDNVVTWINCFVDRDIEDSMVGIADALKDAMLTMQQGGGIGMDFSTLRPKGALLQRTGSTASGPLPFMDMWDAMCKTIMSAGKRRGAMMGVMADNHPDIFEFIYAKKDGRRFKNFNLSVLISDAFIAAVEEDADWDLGFPGVPPSDENFVTAYEVEELEYFFVYKQIKARELWDAIVETTYEYSEPGVVFIDRVNDRNNLYYCEHISATNPCGEQPLPPNGACNLGSVNLARLVRNPFTSSAILDVEMFKDVIDIGVRFLDNVIDTTLYPLEAQQAEMYAKRRIGLGYTGLANALEMCGIDYGSTEAVTWTKVMGRELATTAFRRSALLAAERGTFPLYDAEQFMQGHFVCVALDNTNAAQAIKEHGMRNGTVLSIAPTGTISLKENNASSGGEPVFARKGKRKVLLHDDTYGEYDVEDYGYQIWQAVTDGSKVLPTHMKEARDLSVLDHIRMLGASQYWIDTSVSKTINCPKDMPFEEFKKVYIMAYNAGAKGCTTYRPSDTRGAVLTYNDEDSHVTANKDKDKIEALENRPEILQGKTYKVSWPSLQSALYITINNNGGGRPFEIFCNTASTKHAEWITALTLMISAIMRRGDNIDFIPEELRKVVSNSDIAWIEGTYYGSLVARIGDVIAQHLEGGEVKVAGVEVAGDICRMCEKPTYIYKEGCGICTSCTYSNCD